MQYVTTEFYIGHRQRAEAGRLKLLWCRYMHNDLTWPMHGRYACRRCGIVYTVPWRQGDGT